MWTRGSGFPSQKCVKGCHCCFPWTAWTLVGGFLFSSVFAFLTCNTHILHVCRRTPWQRHDKLRQNRPLTWISCRAITSRAPRSSPRLPSILTWYVAESFLVLGLASSCVEATKFCACFTGQIIWLVWDHLYGEQS